MEKVIKLMVLPLFAAGMVVFSGCKKEPEVPVVKTATVSQITANTAVIESIVSSSGGAAVIVRGVCGVLPTMRHWLIKRLIAKIV